MPERLAALSGKESKETVRVPLKLPMAVGEKVALTESDLAGASCCAVKPVTANGAVALAAVT